MSDLCHTVSGFEWRRRRRPRLPIFLFFLFSFSLSSSLSTILFFLSFPTLLSPLHFSLIRITPYQRRWDEINATLSVSWVSTPKSLVFFLFMIFQFYPFQYHHHHLIPYPHLVHSTIFLLQSRLKNFPFVSYQKLM